MISNKRRQEIRQLLYDLLDAFEVDDSNRLTYDKEVVDTADSIEAIIEDEKDDSFDEGKAEGIDEASE